MKNFSIIVPAYRDEQLPVLLDSVVALDYPQDQFECLICDNSQEGVLENICNKYNATFPPIKYIKASGKPSSYFARNVGIAHAKGEFIFITDDDCRVNRDLLKLLEERFRNPKIDLVKVRLEPGFKNSWDTAFNRKSEFYFSKNYALKSTSFNFPVGTIAVRKCVFDKLGLFDERKRGGDIIFSKKFLKAGLGHDYLTQTFIQHYAIPGFTTYIKRSFAYGFGLYKAQNRDELFSKLSFIENVKFRFFETSKYIGGYHYIFHLLIYMFFGQLGRWSARLKLFKDNPVK